MCLAIPGKVVSIAGGSAPLMGRVSFGGIEKQICLDWVPEVVPGDYVIVHVGFGIARLNEEEAQIALKLRDEMDALARSESANNGAPHEVS